MNIKLSPDEKLEPLGKDYSIIVSKDHTFGTDAVLLADFASVTVKTKACEFGSGCGIISVLWCKGGCNNVTAVEIQEKACSLIERTVKLNELNGRLKVINGDLRELKEALPSGFFDTVCMNPPYKPVGTGIESVSEADKIARHETMCTVDDVTHTASRLLRFGGKLCLCHRPERLADVIYSMKLNRIEPKRLRFVVQQEGKQPWLFLIEGRLGGGHGMTVMNELVMKNADGTNTDELKSIFGDYMDGHQ